MPNIMELLSTVNSASISQIGKVLSMTISTRCILDRRSYQISTAAAAVAAAVAAAAVADQFP